MDLTGVKTLIVGKKSYEHFSELESFNKLPQNKITIGMLRDHKTYFVGSYQHVKVYRSTMIPDDEVLIVKTDLKAVTEVAAVITYAPWCGDTKKVVSR